jgi:hypothetical protein
MILPARWFGIATCRVNGEPFRSGAFSTMVRFFHPLPMDRDVPLLTIERLKLPELGGIASGKALVARDTVTGRGVCQGSSHRALARCLEFALLR